MLNQIQVGEPIRYAGLSVFPLFSAEPARVDYELSEEAFRGGMVTVEEISESGSVPELLVENKGAIRVLFLEGEELVGAKQNRILNTSVLIPAHSKLRLPVSCVEQGRWRYRSRRFGSSGWHTSSSLRSVLARSVSRSVLSERGHRSDQGQVWREVVRQHQTLGVASPTSAMSDTHRAWKDRIAEFQEHLRYVESASGVAVAVGGRLVALDVFDKSATCQKVWNRLLSGFALDALEAPPETVHPGRSDAEQFVELLQRAPWQKVQAVGEGEELRAEMEPSICARRLGLNGVSVHASVLAMPATAANSRP